MGRYDDITDERLRAELTRFARLVLRMEEEGVLIDRTHSVLRLLGELRQMVFAHEVRNTVRDQPPRPHPLTRQERLERDARARDADQPDSVPESGPPSAPPSGRESAQESFRIVREALDRERALLDELTGEVPSDEDDEGREDG